MATPSEILAKFLEILKEIQIKDLLLFIRDNSHEKTQQRLVK